MQRNSRRERAFVSGMGCITSAGLGLQALWEKARSGQPCIHPITQPSFAGARIRQAALVLDDPFEHIQISPRKYDRFAAFALIAVQEAMEMAALNGFEFSDRTAVIFGSGLGGATSINLLTDTLNSGNARVDPMTVPKVMANAAASAISMELGIRGPSYCVSSACASSSQAIGLGLLMIRSGMVDRAIVGGSEAQITPAVMKGWEALRVLTPEKNRPFSARRSGMVIGEGAGAIVLESETALMARSVNPLAELAGYGTTSDADDMLRPNADSAAKAMNSALQSADMDPGDISYVNAHGTGTVLNDNAEFQALSQVFGSILAGMPVSSTKPIHGHTIGAAGAIELIIAIKAMTDGFLPPTINWEAIDPECPLDVVPNEGRRHECQAVLSNSFAFGGINSCLIARAIRE
ncbi:MAG: beta-ketoacyl-[acyl-carrier-protein] synthase family protein [Rhizobiaceae bacterium]